MSILPFDLTGVKSENYILNEEHTFSTTNKILTPKKGPFFKNRLYLTEVESGRILAENEYQLLRLDPVLQDLFNIEVYYGIQLPKNNVTSYSLSYQSVGGVYATPEYDYSFLNKIHDIPSPELSKPLTPPLTDVFKGSGEEHYQVSNLPIDLHEISTVMWKIFEYLERGDIIRYRLALEHIDDELKHLGMMIRTSASESTNSHLYKYFSREKNYIKTIIDLTKEELIERIERLKKERNNDYQLTANIVNQPLIDRLNSVYKELIQSFNPNQSKQVNLDFNAELLKYLATPNNPIEQYLNQLDLLKPLKEKLTAVSDNEIKAKFLSWLNEKVLSLKTALLERLRSLVPMPTEAYLLNLIEELRSQMVCGTARDSELHEAYDDFLTVHERNLNYSTELSDIHLPIMRQAQQALLHNNKYFNYLLNRKCKCTNVIDMDNIMFIDQKVNNYLRDQATDVSATVKELPFYISVVNNTLLRNDRWLDKTLTIISRPPTSEPTYSQYCTDGEAFQNLFFNRVMGPPPYSASNSRKYPACMTYSVNLHYLDQRRYQRYPVKVIVDDIWTENGLNFRTKGRYGLNNQIRRDLGEVLYPDLESRKYRYANVDQNSFYFACHIAEFRTLYALTTEPLWFHEFEDRLPNNYVTEHWTDKVYFKVIVVYNDGGIELIDTSHENIKSKFRMYGVEVNCPPTLITDAGWSYGRYINIFNHSKLIVSDSTRSLAGRDGMEPSWLFYLN